jgi:YfiH family protein
MMILHQRRSVPYYSFELLAQYPQVLNAVFTRLGADRPAHWGLNVGSSVGDAPEAVESNHHLLYRTLELTGSEVVTTRQVHGNNVAVVGKRDCGTVIPEADALVTSEAGVVLMMRFADCVPILLYDPSTEAVGLVHAGWRGTASEVARRALVAMKGHFGSRFENVVAALGPAIGPCCYQVEPDVAQLLAATLEKPSAAITVTNDGHYSLDLWEANGQQLTSMGVGRLEISRICTSCHVSEFFSHRAEAGKTGRFAVLCGIRAES